ncbi:unnamed protein product [Polarella glacialis]|uniref:Saposin B-type domain-containing protein n=2 Tax=Polarella glacialis TaxID=89957 RepID=A0A813L9R5_POLGL|nr:unnamed protein product [Polarella glacialis]
MFRCCAVACRLLAFWLVLGLLPSSAQLDEDDESIPDKVGAEVHLTKQERSMLKKLECSLCKAVITEMHLEVEKHGMTQKGVGSEMKVIETSNAICLALLQKYSLKLPAAGASGKPLLEKKAEDEDDEMAMAASQNSEGGPASFMRAMLVLKMGCQRWIEDFGGDTSGFVFKSVQLGTQSASGAAQDYCVRSAGLCGSGKKERKQKEREQEKTREVKRSEMRRKEDTAAAKAKKDDPFSAMPEDSKFGIQRMLEMARDDPLHYMEDDAKERVRKGQADLKCDVCRTVLDEAFQEVSKRPKSMRSEHDILGVVEGLCEGGQDLSVPSYFGVEPPPLPPVWTDRWQPKLDKQMDKYHLRPLPKKAAKERRAWRALSAEGKQKPPPPGQSETDMMLTLSCKDVLDPARFTEKLFESMQACSGSSEADSCNPALDAATAICRSSDGATCSFGSAAGKAKEDL